MAGEAEEQKPKTVVMQEAVAAATAPQAPPLDPKDHTVAYADPMRQSIWEYVSRSPLGDLWHFRGVSAKVVMQRA